jgi:hypothetical protein
MKRRVKSMAKEPTFKQLARRIFEDIVNDNTLPEDQRTWAKGILDDPEVIERLSKIMRRSW